jgi:hypothetical protein
MQTTRYCACVLGNNISHYSIIYIIVLSSTRSEIASLTHSFTPRALHLHPGTVQYLLTLPLVHARTEHVHILADHVTLTQLARETCYSGLQRSCIVSQQSAMRMCYCGGTGLPC